MTKTTAILRIPECHLSDLNNDQTTRPRHLRLANENPSSPRISALIAFDPCIEIRPSSHTKTGCLLTTSHTRCPECAVTAARPCTFANPQARPSAKRRRRRARARCPRRVSRSPQGGPGTSAPGPDHPPESRSRCGSWKQFLARSLTARDPDADYFGCCRMVGVWAIRDNEA
jgi:hypothetical protein